MPASGASVKSTVAARENIGCWLAETKVGECSRSRDSGLDWPRLPLSSCAYKYVATGEGHDKGLLMGVAASRINFEPLAREFRCVYTRLSNHRGN